MSLNKSTILQKSQELGLSLVGEDYSQVQISPHRKLDLPSDAVARVEGDLVTIDSYACVPRALAHTSHTRSTASAQ